jgi:hypothetical protein
LSGAHPESALLFWQWAPVEPRRTYRLSCHYLTQGLTPDTGLRWAVQDETAAGRLIPLASGQSLRAGEDEWSPSQLVFQSGPATHLVRLELRYQRAAGTTRAQGSIAVADVQVLPAGREADR